MAKVPVTQTTTDHGGEANEMIGTPITEPLCDDEGCQHYGKPHVCVWRQPETTPAKATAEQKHLWFTVDYYRRRNTPNADPKPHFGDVRSGHSDAAHMCDAVAKDIIREHTGKRGPTKFGKELAAAVARAGDAIWAMSKRVGI